MSRESERPPLSEAQLEIMNVVWGRGEVTVADARPLLRVDTGLVLEIGRTSGAGSQPAAVNWNETEDQSSTDPASDQ